MYLQTFAFINRDIMYKMENNTILGYVQISHSMTYNVTLSVVGVVC